MSPRLVHLGVAKLATGVVLATLLSLGSVAAQPPGQPGAAPAAPAEQAQNPALAQFRDVLQRHGSILQHPRYGEVWTPGQNTVQPGWSPYPACLWTYDRQQNAWTYQDPTEWGQIVHHYGRWAFEGQYGWMWIADANYGPGHVYWKNEGGSVSWAALTPDGDGQMPREGWQTQDQQTFNSGCRAASPPPPPVAGYQAPAAPAYAPRPSYAPSYAGPSYGAPRYAAPSYGPPRPVYVPPPPVIAVLPPPPFGHGGFCSRFPFHPSCRGFGPQVPGFCIRVPFHPSCRGFGTQTSAFCLRNPFVPMCRPGGGNGGIAAGLCATNPSLPHCRLRNPLFAGGPGFRPNMLRPPMMRPFPRPGFQVGPQFGRPFVRPPVGPHFGRPQLRPPVGPHFGRPAFRPGPHFARPQFQPRGGFGGGFRGFGGGGFRGGMHFAGRR